MAVTVSYLECTFFHKDTFGYGTVASAPGAHFRVLIQFYSE